MRLASPPPVGGSATSILGLRSAPVDLRLGLGALWVLCWDPAALVRADPVTGRILGRVVTPLVGDGVALDPETGAAWVWSEAAGGTGQPEYDATTLAPRRAMRTAWRINDVRIAFGFMFLSTDHGVYRWTIGSPALDDTPAPGTAGAFTLAADVPHRRLVVSATGGGSRILMIDPRTLRTVASRPVAIGKALLSVTEDGQVWAAGYGNGAHALHLDPRTLRELPRPRRAADTGPGAIVWPGRSVVWLRNGGDTGLACVDRVSGRVLARWPEVQGPVVSSAGGTWAINGGDVERLDRPPGCRG